MPWPVCCPCTDSLLQGLLTHCSTQKPSTEAGHEQVQHRFGIRDPWFLLTSGRALSADQMLWGHLSSTVAVPQPRPHWLEEANIPMLRAACCGQKENVLKTTVLQKKRTCLCWQKCRFHSHLWMTLQGYACDVLCGLTWSVAVCSACSPGSSNTLSHLQLPETQATLQNLLQPQELSRTENPLWLSLTEECGCLTLHNAASPLWNMLNLG